jgi:hypothetical protein
VHWGTWWPVGLPQRPYLIVARLAPSTSVHVLRHGQSVQL